MNAVTAPSESARLDRQQFRDAMAGLAAAVNVITSDGPHGRAGFTATAVCSVTDQPPTLLVCINRSASVYELFTGNGTLCVNTLGHGQQDLSNAFGGKIAQDERFAHGQWTTGETGAPVLSGASLAFECRVSSHVSVGTHDILFCQVQRIHQQDDASALVYFGRQYHALEHARPALARV